MCSRAAFTFRHRRLGLIPSMSPGGSRKAWGDSRMLKELGSLSVRGPVPLIPKAESG